MAFPASYREVEHLLMKLVQDADVGVVEEAHLNLAPQLLSWVGSCMGLLPSRSGDT